jgi:hypothetical protein
MLHVSAYAGEILSVDSKSPAQKKTEVRCTSMFKDPDNIGGSINKIWAKVISTIENNRGAELDESMQLHAYPISREVEVSDK